VNSSTWHASVPAYLAQTSSTGPRGAGPASAGHRRSLQRRRLLAAGPLGAAPRDGGPRRGRARTRRAGPRGRADLPVLQRRQRGVEEVDRHVCLPAQLRAVHGAGQFSAEAEPCVSEHRYTGLVSVFRYQPCVSEHMPQGCARSQAARAHRWVAVGSCTDTWHHRSTGRSALAGPSTECRVTSLRLASVAARTDLTGRLRHTSPQRTPVVRKPCPAAPPGAAPSARTPASCSPP